MVILSKVTYRSNAISIKIPTAFPTPEMEKLRFLWMDKGPQRVKK
jgi:hypothetical protein